MMLCYPLTDKAYNYMSFALYVAREYLVWNLSRSSGLNVTCWKQKLHERAYTVEECSNT